MSESERRKARAPIPVSVLTGFLGSGKTSLLNRLLKDEALADAAVILNEFGEIGLDHLLVETANEGIVELSSGCLCCTIRGDLINTLEGLLRKRDNNRVKPFNRVVIETTGLADPAPVMHTIMAHPYLVLRYRLDGVIATVDAVNGAATLDAYEESVKQVAVADRIVLTKTDLLEGGEGEAALDELKTQLEALNPAAPILDAARGEARADRLFEAGLYNPATKHPDVARWLREEAYKSIHGHEHGHRDVNRHDDYIRAFTVAIDEAVSLSALEMFLDLLRGMHGPNLLRLKGVVRLKDDPDRPLVVHGVQHVFHPPVRLDAWPDADRRTRLVLITRDVKRDKVAALLEALAGRPKVDTASPDVLADNPLSLRGES